MKLSAYDVIVAGHHREVDARLGGEPGHLQGGTEGDQAADQGGGREPLQRAEGGEHARPQGQLKTFRGIRAQQNDTKKAIVTLEEGHSIDVTTGL